MDFNRELILTHLRDYQQAAVEAAEGVTRGKIILPTGTGKTRCQAAQMALDAMSTVGFRAYVVNAPRIVLTYQLLKEYYKFFSLLSIEVKFMFVHSGSKVDESELEDIRTQATLDGNTIPYSEIVSTISTQEIEDNISRAKRLSIPLLVVSTYHSFDKVRVAFNSAETNINIILNDEAHHLVEERFNDELALATADKMLFYTATEKNTDSSEGRGMNNTELFGRVIASMTPMEACTRGLMVHPRLHFVKPHDKGGYTEDDYDKSRNRVIHEAFLQHREVLKIPAKLLVTTKGSNDILDFITSEPCRELQSSGVVIFAVASNEDIGNYVNGTGVDRQTFLSQLNIFGESESEMLILHYDILTEGIDIAGITGVMPMRSLSRTKFRQLFGRVARRTMTDRLRIASGKVRPNDYDLLEKPYAWVVLPYITQNQNDDKEHIKELVRELRECVDNPADLLDGSNIINGIPEEEELEGLNSLDKNLTTVTEIIKDLEAEWEDKRLARMSKYELIDSIISFS